MSRIRDQFAIPDDPGWVERTGWRPRFNLAPQQDAPVVRRLAGALHLDLLHWGLVPSWARDPAIGARLINARSESAGERPAFRAAFRHRRCVVPADGFYEWQAGPAGKQPYYIRRRDGALLALAGLWEHWTGPGGDTLQTFSILTTAADAWMSPLHERMPVILGDHQIAPWLDAQADPVALRALLRAPAGAGLEAYAVSRAVGNARNDRAELLEPLPG